MGRNLERDVRERKRRLEKILSVSFPIFAEKGIETVSMNEIADACSIGIATLYRHYRTKTELVVAVSASVWNNFASEYYNQKHNPDFTAAENFEKYLDSYLDLYKNHKDILQFNQYFNVYIKNIAASSEQMEPFTKVIERIAELFHDIYSSGLRDKTIRTDVSEEEMFSTTMHLMLAAVTRYAIGLVYENSSDQESELLLQKKMLLKEFTV
ncbi:MAG: TetR/AcrR family transcriptional regulator [Anaerolineaceae bacterium]|nr:TetR/AcrR family transcriptional regulator [Anaerolineaceae bacterium]